MTRRGVLPNTHLGMSEEDIEEHIREMCKQVGVMRVHHLRSQGTQAGFPDDVLIGPHGVLWRECKRTGRNPTPAQDRVLTALSAAGQDVAVWRPADLLSGRVAQEITGISRLGRFMRQDTAAAH